ncbi:MAG TPA: hypothetical protein VEH10_03565 [Thermoplasmata archaeon]|nr:hypothetical protein [Thermoplasmata archaeon]
MTASERPGDAASDADEPPADEEYARTYAAGYEEGLRTALRELLAHASRGRTNQELRALIQSRLARLAEEVDLKRRSLLAPPRTRPFGELVREPRSTGYLGGRVPTAAGVPPPVAPKATVLVREVRPERAVELLRVSRPAFPRLALVSLRPPELGEPRGETLAVAVRESGGSSAGHLSPGEVAGRLRAPLESPGGALVYVDALEFFVSEEGPEVTLRFARWLVEQVQATGSALIVSYDPRSLSGTDASRLERLFAEVVDRSAPPRASPT